MLRSIIAVCIGLCSISGYGQDWPHYAEQMEWRWVQCNDPACRATVLAEKLDSAFRSPQVMHYANDVLRDMQRLNWEELSDLQAQRLLWNAALLAYTTGQFEVARRWWKAYDTIGTDESTAEIFLGFLIEMELDSSRALMHVHRLIERDTAFRSMKELGYVRWKVEEPRQWYILAGAILPGSGLMAEGYVLKGLTAMILNSGTAIAIIALLRANLYVNVATWGFLLVQKFYLGHLNLTKNLSEKAHPKRLKKQEAQYQSQLQMLLQRYPLDWKK